MSTIWQVCGFHCGVVFWVMELCNVISGYQELEEHIAAIRPPLWSSG